MSGQTVTQAIATQENRGVIEKYRGDFAAVLPSHIKPDQWVRLTQGVIRRDPKLQRILDNNPGSVLAALLDCARLGLEVGDTYHLVAFGNEVVGISDYTGLIELMFRAGAVSSVKVEVVRERDLDWFEWHDREAGTSYRRQRFEWVPSEMASPFHSPDWFSDRGDLIGVYAYADMIDGSTSQVIMMNKGDVEKHKAESKTARHPDSPWNKWPPAMWKKTAIRQLSNVVPTSAEFRQLTAASMASHPSGGSGAPVSPPPRLNLDDGDVVDGEIVTDDSQAQPDMGTAKPA